MQRHLKALCLYHLGTLAFCGALWGAEPATPPSESKTLLESLRALPSSERDEPAPIENKALQHLASEEKDDKKEKDADEPKPDKSIYNLLHPTPSEFMREIAPDRPDATESPRTL